MTDKEIQAAALLLAGKPGVPTYPDTLVAIVSLSLDLVVKPEDVITDAKEEEPEPEDQLLIWPDGGDDLSDGQKLPPTTVVPEKANKPVRPKESGNNNPRPHLTRKKLEPFHFPQIGDRDLSLKYQCHRCIRGFANLDQYRTHVSDCLGYFWTISTGNLGRGMKMEKV